MANNDETGKRRMRDGFPPFTDDSMMDSMRCEAAWFALSQRMERIKGLMPE